MGNTQVISAGEVQVMTAGTGIFHSEYNKNENFPVKLLQIWVFPDRKNLTPRYDQKEFPGSERRNQWQLIVSPDDPGALKINQSAWFSRVRLDKGKTVKYRLHDERHGVYVFVITGAAEISGMRLDQRDGAGITDTPDVDIKSVSQTEILLMEIPMSA
jgi:redox-sensitive bicupin YhaK (pirin superfamily)